MAIIFSTDNMSEDTWFQLWHISNNDIPSYMIKNYGASLVYFGSRFLFPNKEKYAEFCLKWL